MYQVFHIVTYTSVLDVKMPPVLNPVVPTLCQLRRMTKFSHSQHSFIVYIKSPKVLNSKTPKTDLS